MEQGKITSRQAKDVIAKMFATGADPEEIVKSENLGVSSDAGEIEAVVTAVIAENQTAVNDYKKGKAASLQFLIGKAMAKLKGRARPETLTDLFKRMLDGEASSLSKRPACRQAGIQKTKNPDPGGSLSRSIEGPERQE